LNLYIFYNILYLADIVWIFGKWWIGKDSKGSGPVKTWYFVSFRVEDLKKTVEILTITLSCTT
jgi:hypothetical protein